MLIPQPSPRDEPERLPEPQETPRPPSKIRVALGCLLASKSVVIFSGVLAGSLAGVFIHVVVVVGVYLLDDWIMNRQEWDRWNPALLLVGSLLLTPFSAIIGGCLGGIGAHRRCMNRSAEST